MKIDPDDMISQATAAKIRGVSHEAIRYLVKAGRFKVYMIDGKPFLSRREVEAYVPSKGGRPRKDKRKRSQKDPLRPGKRKLRPATQD
jgi:hypothetical protein